MFAMRALLVVGILASTVLSQAVTPLSWAVVSPGSAAPTYPLGPILSAPNTTPAAFLTTASSSSASSAAPTNATGTTSGSARTFAIVGAVAGSSIVIGLAIIAFRTRRSHRTRDDRKNANVLTSEKRQRRERSGWRAERSQDESRALNASEATLDADYVLKRPHHVFRRDDDGSYGYGYDSSQSSFIPYYAGNTSSHSQIYQVPPVQHASQSQRLLPEGYGAEEFRWENANGAGNSVPEPTPPPPPPPKGRGQNRMAPGVGVYAVPASSPYRNRNRAYR